MFISYGNVKSYSANGLILPNGGVSMGGSANPFNLFCDTPDMTVVATDRLYS